MNLQRPLKSRLQALLSHGGIRRYFLNTGWLFAEKILRLISGLFVGAYMARYLGPAQYGVLNYAISLVAIPVVIAALGLDVIVIREIVAFPARAKTIVGTAFGLKAIAVLVAFVLLVTCSSLLPESKGSHSLVLIISLMLLPEALRVVEFYFMAKVLSKFVVTSQMVALTVTAIVRIVLITGGAELFWFAWTYVLDIAVFFTTLVIFYFRNGFGFRLWRFEKSMARLLLTYSWPMIFSSLAITVYIKIDQIMVKLMLGDEASGFYGVVVRLSEMWNFVPVAICSSVFPAVINARLVNNEIYLGRLRLLYDMMLSIALCVAIGMTLSARIIVEILFGPAYAEAAPVIVMYTWSSVFVFLGVAIGRWMLAENFQRLAMVMYIFAAVLNVILNFIFIPFLGLPGAALSTLISYAFAPYLGLLFNSKTRPMFFFVTASFNVFTLPQRIVRGLKNLRNENVNSDP